MIYGDDMVDGSRRSQKKDNNRQRIGSLQLRSLETKMVVHDQRSDGSSLSKRPIQRTRRTIYERRIST